MIFFEIFGRLSASQPAEDLLGWQKIDIDVPVHVAAHRDALIPSLHLGRNDLGSGRLHQGIQEGSKVVVCFQDLPELHAERRKGVRIVWRARHLFGSFYGGRFLLDLAPKTVPDLLDLAGGGRTGLFADLLDSLSCRLLSCRKQ